MSGQAGWRGLRRAAVVATVALALLGAGAATASARFVPKLTPTGCGKLPKGVRAGRDVTCGRITVPLHHDRPNGRTIQLAVRVVQGGKRTPVLLLGGGPGESVVGLAGPLAASKAFTVRKDRDVILVDQRGVGDSRPALSCRPEIRTAQPTSAGIAAAYGACATRLRKRTDLGAFDTLENAQDLDLVRRALGLRELDVFGTSYGARLALVAARGAPSWMHALVLASPIPGDGNFVADAPQSFDGALSTVFADCAASPQCNATYPALDAQLAQAIARLQAAPAAIPGAPAGVTLTADGAAELLFQLFYSVAGVNAVPEVIARLAAGDYGFLADALKNAPTTTAAVSDGMQRAFICSEEIAHFSPAERQASLAGRSPAATLLGSDDVTVGLPTFPICDAFGVRPAPASTFTPVVSRTPTLVVTGRYDQITPVSYGMRALQGLSHGQLITLPTGHSPLLGSGACGLSILRTYLRAPQRKLRAPRSCSTGAAVASVRDPLRALGAPADPWETLGR